MIIYSEKDFTIVFIKIIKIFFIISVLICIFSGLISTGNILISLIVGGLCTIFLLFFVVLPLTIGYIIVYYFRIKGAMLEINNNGIGIGSRYFGPLKSLKEINIWRAIPSIHKKNMFIPWDKIENIVFHIESIKNTKDFIGISLGPRNYFVIKSGENYYAKGISGVRWDIQKKIKDAIKEERKDFLFTEKKFYDSSGLE